MNHIQNPYAGLSGGQWLKGNLHAPTTESDGKRSRQAVIDYYTGRGYDFLLDSDHDIYTSAETLSKHDARGMVFIPGNEITANGPHLLHVGADRQVAPSRERQQTIQDNVAVNVLSVKRLRPNQTMTQTLTQMRNPGLSGPLP